MAVKAIIREQGGRFILQVCGSALPCVWDQLAIDIARMADGSSIEIHADLDAADLASMKAAFRKGDLVKRHPSAPRRNAS